MKTIHMLFPVIFVRMAKRLFLRRRKEIAFRHAEAAWALATLAMHQHWSSASRLTDLALRCERRKLRLVQMCAY